MYMRVTDSEFNKVLINYVNYGKLNFICPPCYMQFVRIKSLYVPDA